MKAPDEPEAPLLLEGTRPPMVTGTQTVVESGARSDPLPAADAFAWSLVGLLAFCTLCFLAGALTLRYREKHSPPPDDEDDGEKPVILPRTRNRPPEDESPRQPWERDSDWWKK